MRMFDEFDQYSEDMLLSQYSISDMISHELLKGEIREDFLLSTLGACSDPQPKFVKGTISDGEDDAGQVDIILCRPNIHIRQLGSQSMVAKDDALCVIEVKGNCTGRDLTKAQLQAEKILALNGVRDPLYGVIAYKVALAEKTILKRFGHQYDRVNATYFDNATIANEPEANWHELKYPGLDFFVSLEEGKKVFLRKYEIETGKWRYHRDTTTPLIKHVFKLTRSLWVPAQHAAPPATAVAP